MVNNVNYSVLWTLEVGDTLGNLGEGKEQGAPENNFPGLPIDLSSDSCVVTIPLVMLNEKATVTAALAQLPLFVAFQAQ